MRRLPIALLLLAFVAIPITAAADVAEPLAAEPDVVVAQPLPADAPLFADDEDCGPQMSQATLELETPSAQPQSSLCSTSCSDGSTVSCMGPPCFIEQGCFVYCGVRVQRCNSPCP